MAAAFQGFEFEWLEQRLRFLLDRAAAHLEKGANLKKEDIRLRACAATLFKDAAAIAFLLDDAQRGRELLGQAGRHFLKLGLPHGMLLMTLADAGEQRDVALDLMIRAATAKGQADEQAPNPGEFGPLFARALHQPEQLLALEASVAIAEAKSPATEEAWRMREMLRPFRAHPVSSSGISVSTYMRLLDLGRGRGEREADAPGNAQLDMTTLFTQRWRQLASAAADDHHWRLLLSPAALIDIDLVALFSVWRAHGREPEAMAPNLGERLPPMMMMPFRVARLLRFEQLD
jgi:hypothetical protein